MMAYVNRRVFRVVENHFGIGERFTVWDIKSKTATDARFPSAHQITKALISCDRVQVVGHTGDARGAVNIYERLS